MPSGQYKQNPGKKLQSEPFRYRYDTKFKYYAMGTTLFETIKDSNMRYNPSGYAANTGQTDHICHSFVIHISFETVCFEKYSSIRKIS